MNTAYYYSCCTNVYASYYYQQLPTSTNQYRPLLTRSCYMFCLQDDASLSLHMQLLHAPRGVGSLQNAASLHGPWFELVSRAFS